MRPTDWIFVPFALALTALGFGATGGALLGAKGLDVTGRLPVVGDLLDVAQRGGRQAERDRQLRRLKGRR